MGATFPRCKRRARSNPARGLKINSARLPADLAGESRNTLFTPYSITGSVPKAGWKLTPSRKAEYSQPSRLEPGSSRIFPGQSRFKFRVRERFECRPVEGGFEPFAIRRAKPKFNGKLSFADVRMLLQLKTFMQLHLQFR